MDKKPVTFRIEPPILKKLKFLALELDRTVTDLLLEAIKDLMRKYEKKPRKPPAVRRPYRRRNTAQRITRPITSPVRNCPRASSS